MATHSIVQPFTQRGRKLAQEPPRPEKTAASAIQTARRIAERFTGVIAYEIDVEEDDVSEPRLLASHGQVPDDG